MGKDVRETVLHETLRFREAVPGLMGQHAGKWVVFKDGQVQSAHDSKEEALVAGLKKYGVHGGHVVARVGEQPPVPLTAGTVFFAA